MQRHHSLCRCCSCSRRPGGKECGRCGCAVLGHICCSVFLLAIIDRVCLSAEAWEKKVVCGYTGEGVLGAECVLACYWKAFFFDIKPACSNVASSGRCSLCVAVASCMRATWLLARHVLQFFRTVVNSQEPNTMLCALSPALSRIQPCASLELLVHTLCWPAPCSIFLAACSVT